ncbi:chloride intracellular channel exc-4-like [Paramacrobiotus metropolitanus]|uniref:chloride intracellular channel exc-4-like n=1 Tax=Paramacrobiotus metropolitanus TaxID=2943436 RepID=UPI00244618B9|nr:chloride intracellular channel exc-4-like [Paramacrobiotus metropolitanus]
MSDQGPLPEVELLIRASTIDGRRKGACLFCQEYFMELYLLAELKTIALKVTTVDMLKPPADFRSNFEAAHPPILIHDGIVISENDKIERHIMKEIPGGHNLFVQDRETEAKIENLYKKFKMFLLNNTPQAQNSLLTCLKNIDAHLAQKGSRFLTGDSICCFDCELMPRLQNIRIAGKHFYDFEIPGEMQNLWRYMDTMYHLPAFLESCPADQDIIHHYKLQLGLKMSKHEELELPTITKTVPSSSGKAYDSNGMGDYHKNGGSVGSSITNDDDE